MEFYHRKAGRRNLAIGTQIGSVADRRQTARQAETGPGAMLNVIHAQALALWALTISLRFTRPRLKTGTGWASSTMQTAAFC